MERISPIPLFWHFVWVRQPADAEFLVTSQKIAGKNIPIIIKIKNSSYVYIFLVQELPNFFIPFKDKVGG